MRDSTGQPFQPGARSLSHGSVYNWQTCEVPVFAIIGEWRVDGALDSDQLAHIAANVRQQPGFVRGYLGQEHNDVVFAHKRRDPR